MSESNTRAAMPASTVVVVRAGATGLETLMLRRSSRGAFGGMWVFPGGKVDPQDFAGLAPGEELGAARRAAVREAHEEAGIALEPDSLRYFSHWTPPAIAPVRFPTWFFIAPAPHGQVEIDGNEIHDHAWLHPQDAIRRRDAGEIEMAPPTWVTLHRLAVFTAPEAAITALAAGTPRVYITRIAELDGARVSLWEGDAGYDDGDVSRPGPRHRLSLLPGGWHYEDTVNS
ncbi:MAG: NUDIX domain-containing protein [Gammaproteobacteria bacterium]